MSEPPSESKSAAAPRSTKDYSRQLGVVECFVAITNECESGPVRNMAAQALEAIKTGGSAVMREQVYYVLTAIQGWRGERARQIHASLTAFYQSTEPKKPD